MVGADPSLIAAAVNVVPMSTASEYAIPPPLLTRTAFDARQRRRTVCSHEAEGTERRSVGHHAGCSMMPL